MSNLSTVDFKNVKLVLFDLDGTIMETAPDLSKAVNYILINEFKLPPLDISQNRLYIGGGFKLLFEKALEHYQIIPQNIDEIVAKARKYFASINGDEAFVYNNVIDALKLLKQKNIKLGVLTNKISQFALPILQMKGITPYLDVIVAGDTYHKSKPDPEVLHYCCAQVDITADKTILIGDSIYDVKTAKAAGAIAVCVDYGYSDIPVQDLGADIVISDIYSFTQKYF